MPDQSAHRDSVPVLSKGPAEPIIILFQAGKMEGVGVAWFFGGGCKIHGEALAWLLEEPSG